MSVNNKFIESAVKNALNIASSKIINKKDAWDYDENDSQVVRKVKEQHAVEQAKIKSQQAMEERHANQFKRDSKDITSEIPDKGALAVVNNHDISNGTQLTKFGYCEAHADGVADGTVIRVDNKGNWYTVEDENASDDYKAQVSQFKDKYNKAKDDFELAKKFQEMARDGAEESVPDTEADNRVDSFLDLVNDFATISNILSVQQTGGTDRLDKKIIAQAKESVTQYGYTLPAFQAWLDNNKTSKNYQELYNRDPDKAKEALMSDGTLSDRRKNYYAYAMLQQTKDKDFEDYLKSTGLRLLQDVGESLDWLSDPVKATVGYFDSKDGKSWSGIDVGDATLGEAIGSCFQTSWINEGRKAYNYDTGYLPFDIVLEVISDPEFIVGVGSKFTAKMAAEDIVKATSDVDYSTVSKALKSGKSDEEIVQKILEGCPEASRIGMEQVIRDSLKYSNAWKISKSLSGVKEAKQAIDDLLSIGATGGISTVFAPMALGAAKVVKETGTLISEAVKCKAIRDAITETIGKHGADKVTIDTLQECMDYMDRNIASLRKIGDLGSEDVISKDDKLTMIVQAYNEEVNNIQIHINQKQYAIARQARQNLNAATLELLEKNGLEDSALSISLQGELETRFRLNYQDAPNYSAEAYAKITDEDFQKSVTNTVKSAGFNTVKDVDDLYVKDVATNLYTVKANEELLTKAIVSNKEINAILGAFDGTTENTRNIISIMQSPKPTQVTAVIKDIMVHKSGYSNYKMVIDRIDNSTHIPEAFKANIKDTLHNNGFRRKCEGTFSNGNTGLNQSRIYRRSRSLAQSLINSSLSMDAKMAGVDKLVHYGCNTTDTYQNVLAIDKAIKDNPKMLNVKEYDTIVPYSAQLDTTGNLTAISLRINNEIKTYAPNDIAKLDEDLLLLRSESARAGRHVQFVGFNCHATGYDTDAIMGRWFNLHRSQAANILRGSVDLADNIRFSKYSIVPVPESAYDELTNMFQDSINNWIRDDAVLKANGLSCKFSVVPPSIADITRWNDMLDEVKTPLETLNTDEFKMYEVMHRSIANTVSALDDAHVRMNKGIGNITYGPDFYKAIGNLGPDIGIHKALDYESLKEVYNVDGMTVSAGFFYSRHAEDIMRIKNYYRTPEFFQYFRHDIDACWNRLKIQIEKANPGTLEKMYNNGLVDKEGYFLFEHHTDPAMRSAILQHFYNIDHSFILGGMKLDDLKHVPSYARALAQPYNCITRPTEKFFNPQEVLQGVAGNKYSRFNTERDLSDVIQDIDKNRADIEKVRRIREQVGITNELEDIKIAYRHKVLAPVYKLVDQLKNTPVPEYKHVEDFTHNKYTRFWDEGLQHTGRWDELNEGMYTYAHDIYINQIVFVSKMDDAQFTKFLTHQANGMLVIDLNEGTALQRSKLIESFNSRNLDEAIKVDYDDNVLRVYVDSKEQARLYRATKKVPTAVPNFTYSSGHTQIRDVTLALETEFGDSYKFGSFIPNDKSNMNFVANRYFADMPELLHNTLGNNTFFCSYIGNIQGMLGEGSFVSGNMLSNVINSAKACAERFDKIDLIADTVFVDKNIFKGLDNKTILDMKRLYDEQGYSIIACLDNGTIKDVSDWDLFALKRLNKATVLRADEAQALITHANSLSTINATKLHTVYSKTRSLMWNLYLKWMLHGTPFPGLNNWKDSTAKAVLQKGTEHFGYMKKAVNLIDGSRSAFEWFYKTFDKCDDKVIDTVAKHGWNFSVSPEELKMLVTFKNSTVSGCNPGDKTIMNTIREVVDDNIASAKTPVGKAVQSTFGRYISFNEWLFGSAESVNRLAIFLNDIDHGANFGTAYKDIKMSQFDYSKGAPMKALEMAMPFSGFKLANMQYWLKDVWEVPGASGRMNTLAKVFNSSYDDDPYEDWFWSDDMIDFRAYIDTCNFEDRTDYDDMYNKFQEYSGTSVDTAKSNGWIKMGDHIYFKTGMSYLDAFTGIYSFTLGAGDNLFTPLKVADTLFGGTALDDAFSVGQMRQTGEDTWEEYVWQTFISEHGYDIASLLPVIGAIYYTPESIIRNEMYADRVNSPLWARLMMALPGMFAPARMKQYGNAVHKYDKPVGYNWYDESTTQEYRDSHQYVQGMSYLPAWVSKDPATYINTLGRLQQILGGTEGAYEFMQLGDGFWFTKDGDTYKLHNYKLMIGDEQTRGALLDSLMNKFGWSHDAAVQLLDTWGEPMWTKKNRKYSNTYEHMRGYGRFGNAYIPAGKGKYTIHPKPRMLSDNLGAGKNVKLSGFALSRQQNNTPMRMPRAQRNEYRWHRRTRDIYKNNYARYGASRMAMEQNLQNYSNRSVTEMRRTNQTLRYNDIHRHTSW